VEQSYQYMGHFISGSVVSGKGEAREIMSLDWVKWQMREKLGFLPHPGTLNLKLSNENIMALKHSLSEVEGALISKPGNDSVCGICYRVVIMHEFEGALVFPKVRGHDEEIVEVMAPFPLRERLSLKDGDEVILEIQ